MPPPTTPAAPANPIQPVNPAPASGSATVLTPRPNIPPPSNQPTAGAQATAPQQVAATGGNTNGGSTQSRQVVVDDITAPSVREKKTPYRNALKFILLVLFVLLALIVLASFAPTMYRAGSEFFSTLASDMAAARSGEIRVKMETDYGDIERRVGKTPAAEWVQATGIDPTIQIPYLDGGIAAREPGNNSPVPLTNWDELHYEPVLLTPETAGIALSDVVRGRGNVYGRKPRVEPIPDPTKK